MEAYLESIEADFRLSNDKLRELTEIFETELEKGLEKDDGMFRALPTFVYSLPKGTEIGKFLTVDLGGTNLRIGLVELLGSGDYSIQKDSFRLSDELKACGNGKEIFNFIADKIKSFLARPEIVAELPLQLGFTFSFPVEQESLEHGRILAWSKEIVAENVIGEDAVALLQEALHARQLDIKVAALINDTVGTLLAQIYRDQKSRMSVILGTGSNAAYVEKCSRISKLKGRFPKNCTETIINTEWGSFGDSADGESSSILPCTRFDCNLDHESTNPGVHKFEKMISGMYLGEIFRLILCEAAQKGIVVFSENATKYSIKTKDMSIFHEAFLNEDWILCDSVASTKFSLSFEANLSQKMFKFLSSLCELISFRSCRLCAVGITAIHRHLLRRGHLNDSQQFSVALDGALYQKYPNYSTILQDLVCEMDADMDVCRVILVMAEDLSSVGAAAAIAASQNNNF